MWQALSLITSCGLHGMVVSIGCCSKNIIDWWLKQETSFLTMKETGSLRVSARLDSRSRFFSDLKMAAFFSCPHVERERALFSSSLYKDTSPIMGDVCSHNLK